MNLDSSQYQKEVRIYSFFNYCLESTNSFKAQIRCGSEKMQENEPYFSLVKKVPNQNYNSNQKLILLQNSISQPLTPKKQLNEEIGQYFSDRNISKIETFQFEESDLESSPSMQPELGSIKMRPLKNSKLQEEIRKRLNKSNQVKKAKQQPQLQMNQSEIVQQQQQDSQPKRGLTYISKRLSEILREKKRIKSADLFSAALFEEEERAQASHPVQRNAISPKTSKSERSQGRNQQSEIKDSKQRRNIRRRIYDSINVMVALGIVKKVKNEFIYCEEEEDQQAQDQALIQHEQILSKKFDYMNKLQADCQYKQKCLKYLTESYAKLKILRRINLDSQDKFMNENTLTSSLPFTASAQNLKFQFPLILFENGQRNDIKVQLRSDPQNPEPSLKKLNDWTDFIQVQGSNEQNELSTIKVTGEGLKMISDLDCVNLLQSLQVDQNSELYQKYKQDVLRDYDFISHHQQQRFNLNRKGQNQESKFGKQSQQNMFGRQNLQKRLGKIDSQSKIENILKNQNQ